MATSTTVNGGTVLTIPANRLWQGSVGLSATLTVAIGGAAASAVPTVTVSGTGQNVSNGDTLAAVALAVPAVNALALLGGQATATAIGGPLTIQTGSQAVSLILNFPAPVTAVGWVCGALQ